MHACNEHALDAIDCDLSKRKSMHLLLLAFIYTCM